MAAQLFTSQSGQPHGVPAKDPMRGSVRFPLHLPVNVYCGTQWMDAVTEDISSTGVQFAGTCTTLQVGMEVSWTLCLPAAIMGTPHDVTVECTGRVMWLREQPAGCRYGVVIDSYLLKDKQA